MIVMFSTLTVGFIVIRIHQQRVQQKMLKSVFRQLKEEPKLTFDEAKQRAAESVFGRPISFAERFFSLKALHGLTMACSWYMMFGRAIVTNPATQWQGCWTYPALKALDANGMPILVPAEDPQYSLRGHETMFFFSVVAPAVALFIVVGVIWSFAAAKRSYKSHVQF